MRCFIPCETGKGKYMGRKSHAVEDYFHSIDTPPRQSVLF